MSIHINGVNYRAGGSAPRREGDTSHDPQLRSWLRVVYPRPVSGTAAFGRRGEDSGEIPETWSSSTAMAPVRVRRSRKASKSERLMR
jgi:hypothetical protein